jgi:hypothetical protein
VIRRWGVNVLLVVALLVVGRWQYEQNSQAAMALCALRHNLEVRVESSEKYLRDVAAGYRRPVPGITTADINTSIKNQQATINALSNLDCSKEIP